jgi:hypothetical protein
MRLQGDLKRPLRSVGQMEARIYQPAKNAMQSGRAKQDTWVLEYLPVETKKSDPLMGWSGSGDTNTQVKLKFPSCEAAVARATSLGLDYAVKQPKSRIVKAKSYADNFRTGRVR